jgi:hypothetical protein
MRGRIVARALAIGVLMLTLASGDAAALAPSGERAGAVAPGGAMLLAATGGVAQPWGMAPAVAEGGEADPVLVDAWRRHGCHLNPSNPSCAIVALAVECADNPHGPACAGDRDGDGCRDVAEVRAGFDPLDGADCLAAADGEPAGNCLLFPLEFPCGERREGPESGGAALPGLDPCQNAGRDPTCDGFAPGSVQ